MESNQNQSPDGLKDKYKEEQTWHGKVIVMEIYHLAMLARTGKWTIADTASRLEVSIGLVSENLRLAEAIHKDARYLKCESRQAALKRWYANRVRQL